MNKFLYRDDDHTYWALDEGCGEYFRIPSVTETIKPILGYSKVPKEVLSAAGDRGTNIHATARLWVNGKLDEEQLEEGNRIALDAFKEWWDKERLGHDQLIMDIKTRKPYMPYDSVQIEGYQLLLTQGIRINNCYGIKNGLYVEEPHGHPKLKFGGTPDYVKYNPFRNFILFSNNGKRYRNNKISCKFK